MHALNPLKHLLFSTRLYYIAFVVLEMAGRQAIHERMQQETMRRVDKDNERQNQSEEDTINRMIDHQSAVMNAALAKAQMELLTAGDDARRAQEELRAVEESVMLSVQRIRVEEELAEKEKELLAFVRAKTAIFEAEELKREQFKLLEIEQAKTAAVAQAERFKMEEQAVALARENERLQLEAAAVATEKERLTTEKERLQKEADKLVAAQALHEIESLKDTAQRSENEILRMSEAMRLMEARQMELALETERKMMVQLLLSNEAVLARQAEEDAKQARDQEEVTDLWISTLRILLIPSDPDALYSPVVRSYGTRRENQSTRNRTHAVTSASKYAAGRGRNRSSTKRK